MRKLINELIEKVEYFEVSTEEWKELKKDILKELKVKDTPDNQYLWSLITKISEMMNEFVG